MEEVPAQIPVQQESGPNLRVPEQPDVPQKSNKKLLVIVAVIGLLLLVGIGVLIFINSQGGLDKKPSPVSRTRTIPERVGTTEPERAKITDTPTDLDVLPTATTEVSAGSLKAGSSVDIPIDIDSSSGSIFFLTWFPEDSKTIRFLTVSLTSPDGTVIDTNAALNSEEIYYDESKGGPELPPNAGYSLNKTTPGTWMVNLSSDVDISYQVFAAFESPLTMAADTNKFSYAIGNTAIVSAELSTNEGLSEISITADVGFSNGVKAVELKNTVGNVYEASFEVPDSPGFGIIDVVVKGNNNGLAFSREEIVQISILPESAKLTSVFSTNARDDDGNGLFEHLDFVVEIESKENKNFSIQAELMSGDKFVAHRGDFFDLVKGTNSITLNFLGKTINRSGLNGPYTIKDLKLIQTDIGLPSDSMDTVLTTEAYSYTQFE